jgi:hypothetical protein
MSNARKDLICALVADLRPVQRAGVEPSLVSWLVLVIPYSAAAVVWTDPFREGAFPSLVAFPAFAAETIVAVLAVVALARAALSSGLPGAAGSFRLIYWPAILVATWLAFYIVGLWWPAHPVSELGHRNHCALETLFIALPSLVLMLWYVRRLFPLTPRMSGMLAGAAAAAAPAAWMQFACMYSPTHIMAYHLAPVAVMAAAGALLAPALLARRPGALNMAAGGPH